MNYNLTLKNFTFISLTLVLILVLAACSSEETNSQGEADASEEEIYNIKVATALDLTNKQMAGFPIFKEIIEETSDGRIQIEHVGGPEAIPGFNQGEAVSNGTVDMSWVFSSYYAESVPEALVSNFTELSYEEEIERGSFEYLSELHENAMNVKVLGRGAQGKYSIFLNDEVNSTEDFAGLKIRGTATYAPLLQGLGADAISMEGGEIYTALERGMIDGFAWANYSVTDLGVQELVNYQVVPDFNTNDLLILMNANTMENLPEDLQELVREAAIQSYYEMAEGVEKVIEEEHASLKETGTEFIELEDSEKFQTIALEQSWEWLNTRINSDISELEKYFRK
ncbi:TRAP transporter substrate-binding protein DctP [Planococcus salinus]|nr:TRAP transporter substrate-binding protein DctP [Planococcus salinus]